MIRILKYHPMTKQILLSIQPKTIRKSNSLVQRTTLPPTSSFEHSQDEAKHDEFGA
jgi:hypothetical protein